jgi:acetoin utilization deacetylase AcuC-like enzyme
LRESRDTLPLSLHIHDPTFYPYANTSGTSCSYGSSSSVESPNIVNVAVPPHTDSATFKQLFETIVEKVRAFQPSMLFISGDVLRAQAPFHFNTPIATLYDIKYTVAHANMRIFTPLQQRALMPLALRNSRITDRWSFIHHF